MLAPLTEVECTYRKLKDRTALKECVSSFLAANQRTRCRFLSVDSKRVTITINRDKFYTAPPTSHERQRLTIRTNSDVRKLHWPTLSLEVHQGFSGIRFSLRTGASDVV